jgi:uncharacterized protein DUF6941
MDGKVSIMGVFGVIHTAAIPATHPSCFLVFEVELDYTEIGHAFEVRVECVDEDGGRVFVAKMEAETSGKAKPGTPMLLPLVWKLPPLRFQKEGRHDVNFFLGTEPGAKLHLPLQVVKLPRQPIPPSEPRPS